MGINSNIHEECVIIIVEKLQVENSVFFLMFLDFQLHFLKRDAELRASALFSDDLNDSSQPLNLTL